MDEIGKCETRAVKVSNQYEKDPAGFKEFNAAGEKCMVEKRLETRMKSKMKEFAAPK